MPGNLPSTVTHRLTVTAGAAQETVSISTFGPMVVSGAGQIEERSAVATPVIRCEGRWMRLHQAHGDVARNNLRLTLAPFAAAFIDTETHYENPPWDSDDLGAVWEITPAQGTTFDIASPTPEFRGAYGVELDFAMTRLATRVYAVAGTAAIGVDSGRVELWGYAPGKTRANRLTTVRVRDGEWSIPRLSLPRTGRWEFYARYRTAGRPRTRTTLPRAAPFCASARASRRDRSDGRAQREEKRRPERGDLFDREAGDVRDHWKISVVQSPPWRRVSCARAGPSARSWKSTKKPRSISMPPSGAQSTRSSQECSPG